MFFIGFLVGFTMTRLWMGMGKYEDYWLAGFAYGYKSGQMVSKVDPSGIKKH
jgi:hypothetical protein